MVGFNTTCWRMERTNQFVGQSLAFLDAVERASRAAPLNRPVLVIGERGTGKELIAERLHHLSSRWAGPLVTMNCAALPENLIEAELFGHEAGSFTGAAKTRHGRFEEADGGTLFLDELATLSSPAQDRLLRAVEYGEVTRIGASKPIQVDVRIVAATNEHLPRLVAGGPLSRRPARPAVVRGRHPAAASGAQGRHLRCSPSISGGAWRSSSTGPTGRASRTAPWRELENYAWPGNVRELRNVDRAGGLSRRRSGAGDRRHPVRSVRVALGLEPRSCRCGRSRRPCCSSAGRSAGSGGAPPRCHRRRPARRGQAYEKALLEEALARHRFNQRTTAARWASATTSFATP